MKIKRPSGLVFQTRKYLVLYILICLLWCSVGKLHSQSLSDLVEPLAGTAPSTTEASRLHSEAGSETKGNTIPAVGLPFGMTQFTPQTNDSEQKCQSPYEYNNTQFKGFRASHWLSGSCTQDYGSTSLMAVSGSLGDSASLKIDHNLEHARPYLYSISFPGKYKVQLTATLRSAIWAFTMLKDDSLFITVRPNSEYREGCVGMDQKSGDLFGANPVHRIYQGWGKPAGFKGYFYLQSNQKAVYIKNGDPKNKNEPGDLGKAIVMGYYLHKGDKLLVRMGTSFSSKMDARKNLQTEIPDWDFKALVRENKLHWEEALGKIKVYSNNERQARIFYTALYHSFQQPRLFSDVSGHYPAFDGGEHPSIKTSENGDYYGDFSMWDIYRAQLPLLMIIRPGLVRQFARSMLMKSKEGGWLPIFPCWNSYTAAMIGDHVTAFIASAYQFGIRDFSLAALYPYLHKNAFDTTNTAAYLQGKGRRALKSYLRYGFIPTEDSVMDAFHHQEQVSRTLEYAYDDYALSVLARALGKRDDYLILRHRALNYQNVFDPSVGMVRGKSLSGVWSSPFSPYKRASYITEGTPAQYSFYVPQDIKGMGNLMGGASSFEKTLDALFENKGYWHGNEPGHEIPFLYNFTPSPFKTQEAVRGILEKSYSDGPGGLDGNDDAGQMSAWYVFAAMGFYPVDPVSGNYPLCSPLFDSVVLDIGNSRKLSIITHKAYPNAFYIDAVQKNGAAYNLNFLQADVFRRGGRLDIWLTEKPSKWGSKPSARAPSLSDDASGASTD